MKKIMSKPVNISRMRRYVLMGLMLTGFAVLAGRSGQLQLLDREFLQGQGDMRPARCADARTPWHDCRSQR